MSADELRNYGDVLLDEPYACAFIMWRHDPDGYSYFSRPDIGAAAAELAALGRFTLLGTLPDSLAWIVHEARREDAEMPADTGRAERRGFAVEFVGPAGAGKTTLVRAIGSQVPLESGSSG